MGHRERHPQTTPGRALNTNYTNSTGRYLAVYACVDCDAGTSASRAVARCRHGPNTSSYTTYMSIGITAGVANDRGTFELLIIVPPGYSYRINRSVSGTGTVTLVAWTEYQL